MKSTFAIAAIIVGLSACNDATTENDMVDVDTTTGAAVTTTTPVYLPSEGDVSYRSGRVVVWRNNEWEETNEDVTLDNGIAVRKNGEVKRDNDVVVLNDGEVVSRTGNFFDKAGNAIEDAWDATKRGAKKAGNEIENAGEKVGEKAKDVFDGEKKDENK